MKQSEINRSWSESAPNYDSIIHDELRSFRVKAWQKQILSHVPAGQTLQILDIGCGPGFFSIILSAKGHDVTGIDGADGMLQRARANVAAVHSDADILQMDANCLDFPDGTFDLVVSRNVTHTLLNHAQTYTEWKRVLKPGGLLLIFCPGADGSRDTGHIYAPFRLSTGEERLFLYAPDGTLSDRMLIRDVPYGGSIGRLPEGSGSYYFSTPTPQKNNTAGFRRQAPLVTASAPRGSTTMWILSS